jgi:hypothetical protein
LLHSVVSSRRLKLLIALSIAIGAIVAILVSYPSSGEGGSSAPDVEISEHGQTSAEAGPMNFRRKIEDTAYSDKAADRKMVGEQDGASTTGQATLTKQEWTEIHERMLSGIAGSNKDIEQRVRRDDLGVEWARYCYLLAREELALAKFLAGDFALVAAKQRRFAFIRQKGDPDWMHYPTSRRERGLTTFVRISFTKAEEEILSAARSNAALHAIRAWEAFVEDFNSLSFETRRSRVVKRKLHAERLSALAKRIATESVDSETAAKLNREMSELREKAIPWYASVNPANFTLAIRRSALELAKRRGGL